MVELVESSDILDVQRGIICHQVNCIGVMGAGLALQIRKKWPKVCKEYQADCKTFESCPQRLLGHVQDIRVNDDLVVANCYGQVMPGTRCMTDYRAWDTILDKLKDTSNYFGLDCHFPWMVGCGLAGGDWNVMKKKIESAFAGNFVKAYIHRLPIMQS